MPKRRSVLLRIANVNPDSVNTHSDRVLYRAIGVFIVLYFAYATAGGAAFVDASAGYAHPWWQWVVGALVATGVVAYDRAVVGRVAVSFEHLESADPRHLLKRPTLGLYLGRLGLALLFAVLITEPLMLARYRGEIDARLSEVHSQQIAAAESRGALSLYRARLGQLAALTAADDRSVAAVTAAAVAKRRDARTLYAQALSDSAGGGVSRRRGCPAGGYCDALVRRSRSLYDQATALDAQAAKLQDSRRTTDAARTAEAADLTNKINAQRTDNAAAIAADAGFGARTKAMWHLVTSDFWGTGVFYAGIALLLVALDCAAVALKFVSHGNAYERTEARVARHGEHVAAVVTARQIRDAEAYGEAAARVVEGGIDAAMRDEDLVRAATGRARANLAAAVLGAGAAEIAALADDASFVEAGSPADNASFLAAALSAEAEAGLLAESELFAETGSPAESELFAESASPAESASLAEAPSFAESADVPRLDGVPEVAAADSVAWVADAERAARAAGTADVAAAMAAMDDRQEHPDSSDQRDLQPDFDAVRA
jgi:hypothetical protein